MTQEDLFALTCYLHLKSWSQQKIWAKSFHSCRATLPATGNIGVIKNWKGKMATVRKGSIEWPTMVDCEDAFKSACNNDTYTYCVWCFVLYPGAKTVVYTIADSSHIEITSSPSAMAYPSPTLYILLNTSTLYVYYESSRETTLP